MHTLRIEHAIHDFDTWMHAFESDPAQRGASGVRNYRILRDVEDPLYVMIDLDFDQLEEVEAFLETMRKIWNRVEGTVMTGPQSRIAELVRTGAH